MIEVDDGPGLELIREDLQYVHEDVTFTLGDIWQRLGCLGRGHTVEDYQTTWDEICEQAEENSNGKPLHMVLEGYKRFLEGLCKKLESHVRTPTVDPVRDEMYDMNARKKKRPTETVKRVSAQSIPNASSTKAKTSPKLARTNSFRQTTPQSLSRATSLRVNTPQSPTLKKSYERERPWSPTDSTVSSATEAILFREKPPWVPSPPLSPTATMSSISAVSSAESVKPSPIPKHWAKTVFTAVSSTPFPWTSEETHYHEQRNTKEHTYPSHEYDSVLNLSYPEGVRISLFCRASDYRAKIVVLYRDHAGKSDYGCLPLEDLHLRREGSILRLCRRRSSNGKSVPWVTMKFTTIQRLVLFAGTFIAMRSQDDTTDPPPPVIDSTLANETCEFAGSIIDSKFSHALGIYRDAITGCIRLQASVLKGELDRTPVWTAFITDSIKSMGWCRQVDKKTILLAGLRLHIFSARYRPESTLGDGFILRFEMKADAEDFLDVISALRREGLAGH